MNTSGEQISEDKILAPNLDLTSEDDIFEKEVDSFLAEWRHFSNAILPLPDKVLAEPFLPIEKKNKNDTGQI